MVGDGAGGNEARIGDYPTREACYQAVSIVYPFANGATYPAAGTACYAEFGMTGSNDSSGWQSCMW